MKTFTGISLILISLTIWVSAIVIAINFDRNCSGHLKRAADANTIEMAAQELNTGLTYLVDHNLTKGYTSIIYTTPDEDIEFWYNNLKSSYDGLINMDTTSTELEKSNMLMKLRETILDHGESGDELTEPSGISRYPSNGLWCVLFCLSGVFTVIGGIMLGIDLD